MTEKPIERHFAEWESETFGLGYGTGESHVLGALRDFMMAIPPEGPYDYLRLEAAVTPAVAWLLINALCPAEIIEYGTSPRYGWLTKEGRALRAFLAEHDVYELVAFCCEDGIDYCAPTFCNCGPDGYTPKKRCFNPFWQNS